MFLLQFVFATDTHAVGLNMPARTVFGTSLVKQEGGKMRFLYSSEYTQMIARAGRRGADKFGQVIVLVGSNLREGTQFE